MDKRREILGEEEFNRIENLARKQRFLLESGEKREKKYERRYRPGKLPLSPEDRKDFIDNYYYMRKNRRSIMEYLGLTFSEYEHLEEMDPDMFEEAKKKAKKTQLDICKMIIRTSAKNGDNRGFFWVSERLGGMSEANIAREEEEAAARDTEEFSKSPPRLPYMHLLYQDEEENE